MQFVRHLLCDRVGPCSLTAFSKPWAEAYLAVAACVCVDVLSVGSSAHVLVVECCCERWLYSAKLASFSITLYFLVKPSFYQSTSQSVCLRCCEGENVYWFLLDLTRKQRKVRVGLQLTSQVCRRWLCSCASFSVTPECHIYCMLYEHGLDYMKPSIFVYLMLAFVKEIIVAVLVFSLEQTDQLCDTCLLYTG